MKDLKLEVASLETLVYMYHEHKDDEENILGSLVIDSPKLKTIIISDHSGDSCSIENTPRLNKAIVNLRWYPGDKFIRYLSSLIYLHIFLNIATVECRTINFSQLIECKIRAFEIDWLGPLMDLLQNSPKLKVLLMNMEDVVDLPVSWNHPASVPKCLLTHLEIFEWEAYGGSSQEKELVRYILANSRRLKSVAVSIKSTCNLEDREKMMDELKAMFRISESSHLMFDTVLVQKEYSVHDPP